MPFTMTSDILYPVFGVMVKDGEVPQLVMIDPAGEMEPFSPAVAVIVYVMGVKVA